MAIWEDVKKITVEFAHSTADISKKLAEITRLNLNNVRQEDNIKSFYMEVGKKYYEEFCNAPGNGYDSYCSKIKACKDTIEENNRQIAALKTSLKKEDRTEPAEELYETATADPSVESEPISEPIAEITVDSDGTVEPIAEIRITKSAEASADVFEHAPEFGDTVQKATEDEQAPSRVDSASPDDAYADPEEE